LPNVPARVKENENLKEGAAMFGITSETLRQFSLAEILLLIAMNIETSRLAFENRARLATGTALGS
jgi:hypothetical protein